MACMLKNGITMQILGAYFPYTGEWPPGAASRNFARDRILSLVPLEEQQVSRWHLHICMKLDSYGNKQNKKQLPRCAKEQWEDSKAASENQTR